MSKVELSIQNVSQRQFKFRLEKHLLAVLRIVITIFKKTFGILVFLAAWEIASRTGAIDTIFIPPFTKVVVSFYDLIVSGELPYHAFISLKRALLGFFFGIVVAVPSGLLIGRIKIVEAFMDPVVQTFRQTSTLALMPVFLLLFGIGEPTKVIMIYWGVQWPILLNTISGTKNIDPLLIKAARSMGTSSLDIFRKVILPGTLPSIFTGIRLGGTSAILLLIAAEMVGASSGLGFLVFDLQIRYQIPKMFAVVISFSILGLILNYILVYLEQRFTRWKDE
ncbi:MAG: ssuC 10 [Paenibacillaceae bacterium]|nr:ssuC 10 [Paenibacillaceae bacterium]